MAHKKKGHLTTWIERHKHLRKIGKRFFWSRERLEERNEINQQVELDSSESNSQHELRVTLGGQEKQVEIAGNFDYFNSHVGIKDKNYRNIAKDRLNAEDYNWLIERIGKAVEQSERLATEFILKEEDVELLYSVEFEHYHTRLDILSYGLNNVDANDSVCEFDIGFCAQDEQGQVIFMYDTRGSCSLRYKLFQNGDLQLVKID